MGSFHIRKSDTECERATQKGAGKAACAALKQTLNWVL
jgi:hypothetical protein